MSHGTSKQKLVAAALAGAQQAHRHFRGKARQSLDHAPQSMLSLDIADAVNRLAQPCTVELTLPVPANGTVDARPAGPGRSRVSIRVLAKAGDVIAAIEVHPGTLSTPEDVLAGDIDRLAHAILYKPYKSKLAYAMVATWLSATTERGLEQRRSALVEWFDAALPGRGVRKHYVFGAPVDEGERRWLPAILVLSRPVQIVRGARPVAFRRRAAGRAIPVSQVSAVEPGKGARKATVRAAGRVQRQASTGSAPA